MKYTSPLTTQSLFVILTGATNSGKSYQLLSILEAEVDGQPIATPTLFLLCESSSEGTIGAIINDPSRACVWPVKDCAEAIEAINACFPRSGPVTLGSAKDAWLAWARKTATDEHAAACKAALEAKRPAPPPPVMPTPLPKSANDAEVLRAAVVDTATTLYRGSMNTAKELYAEEARKKNKGVAVVSANKKDDPSQNDMNLHGYAARVCHDLVNRLNAITMHRGTMVFVSVHTCPAIVLVQSSPTEPAVKLTVGETPALGTSPSLKEGLTVPSFSKTWDALAAKANIVVHAFADIPNYNATNLASINDDATSGTKFGLITERGMNYPKIGNVTWVKRQDGAGPWGYLACMPRYWHPDVPVGSSGAETISSTPDIGKMLAYSIRRYRDDNAAA